MSEFISGYDYYTSTFSPDGRLFQIEYAQKAVENSGTAIGLRGEDGVVFAVEKFITSKLYEVGTNRRIFTIDRHIGVAVSGLITDAQHIVEVARTEAETYRVDYHELVPLKTLKERVSMYMHAYTLYSGVRPFGASVIMGAYDFLDGPQMYCVDPSGISSSYFGCAIGKGKEIANTELEKINFTDKTIEELVNEAAKIIYIIHEEAKEKDFELELSWVGEITGGKHTIVPTKVFENAESYAIDALEEDYGIDDE